MFSLKFFIAVIVTTISSGRSSAGSTLLALVFSFMFMVIFSLWKSKYGDMHLMYGMEFGALC